MSIQPVNNTSFRARVKMKKLSPVYRDLLTPEVSIGSSTLGSATSTGSGFSAVHTIGTTSDVAATAFSAQASGINSSGIVPAIMQSAAPELTPATVATVNNHPSVIGTFFSSVGNFFHNMGKVKINAKTPN